MLRLLLLIMLLPAPLAAVTAEKGTPVRLHSLRVLLDLAGGEAISARATCRATLHNPGAEAVALRISLPASLVPKDQHESFTLKLAGLPRKPDNPKHLRWDIEIPPGARMEATWTSNLRPVGLPHLHPLGKLAVRIELAHIRHFAALPDEVEFNVTTVNLPPELFDGLGRDIPVDGRIEDISFEWLASTFEDRRAALESVRGSFNDAQRNHLNRSYTGTLVDLADLYALKDLHEPLADTCNELARLEADAGTAITHCGPWAKWRKHVPWRLRQVQALRAADAAGDLTKKATAEAKTHMAVLWPAYLDARERPRPFDHFNRRLHGGFGDYDWDRTRELYALVLELSGDATAAADVRDSG
jgi:hypothetical protein